MGERIVITGVGVLASNGKGMQEYGQSLQAGKSGHAPVTLFDTSPFKVNVADEVKDFDPKVYMGPKGLRSLDRSTKLLVSASKLAVRETKFEITDENTDDVGVSVGTTFGSLQSITDFDAVTLREGPRYTNPSLFPNTVMNSPASQVSIWNNIQGFNTTISTGFTASLDAMSYAYDFIQMGRVKMVFTGGVEEMCFPTYFGFYAVKFMTGAEGNGDYISCPFDKRRNGIILGEGACLLAFEDLHHAQKRKADILGEVLGFGYYFDTDCHHKYNPRGTGMIKSMNDCLKNAGCEPQDIDWISASANSTRAGDRIETNAIKKVFGREVPPVSAVKSMTGECYSVSGSLQAAAAVVALKNGFIPPTANYQEKDPHCDLDYVPNQARQADLKKILINSFGPCGNHSSMIISRYEP